MNQTNPSGGRGSSFFLIAACVALGVLVLLLAWQNRALKDELAAATARQAPPEGLAAGDRFQPLVLLDDGGNSTALRLGESEPRSLLLVFTTHCPACRETIPVWGSLLEDPLEGIRVLGIRLGGEVEDIPFLPFAVFTPEDGGAGLAGKIPFVPATLILDGDGTVEQVWYGMLDEEKQRAVGDALSSALSPPNRLGCASSSATEPRVPSRWRRRPTPRRCRSRRPGCVPGRSGRAPTPAASCTA